MRLLPALLTTSTLVLAPACVRPGPAMPASWVGTPQARRPAFMSFNALTEVTPPQVRHDAVRDEATLVSLDAEQACFAVDVRTAIGYDEPIDALEPRCKSDKGWSGATASAERISVIDYDLGGAAESAAIHEILRDGDRDRFNQVSSVAVPPQVFRVVERATQLCCPIRGNRLVRLELTSPRLRVGEVGGRYRAAFAWALQPGEQEPPPEVAQ